LLGRFDSLADRLGNFLGLARTIADHARGGIAYHNQRGKRHVLAALDHLGYAIDGHYLVLQVVLVGIEFLFQHRHFLSQFTVLSSEFSVRSSASPLRTDN